jgi:hypothetical protein
LICGQNLLQGHSLTQTHLRSSMSPYFTKLIDHQYEEPTEHSHSEIDPRPKSSTGSRAWSYSSRHVVIEQGVSCRLSENPWPPSSRRTSEPEARTNKRKRPSCPNSRPRSTPDNPVGNEAISNSKYLTGKAPLPRSHQSPSSSEVAQGYDGLGLGNSNERAERRKALRRTTGPCTGGCVAGSLHRYRQHDVPSSELSSGMSGRGQGKGKQQKKPERPSNRNLEISRPDRSKRKQEEKKE